ncbi:hypothetical protein EJ07DRAFT_130650 [Lizonia empirigonia]|nr:hypothetical protein EJ07DRAFT_149167 [Lizonia empirigonia]KAF1355927.1 hypothetical protein EJ07DRAFT_130650 [Lizonia empirigonia]
MKPEYQAGRIHRDAFVISTSCLIGLIFIAVAARFITQIRARKPLAFDDGFLLIGLATLIAALVIFYTKVIEPMYLTFALITRTPGVVSPPVEDLAKMSDDFRVNVTVTLILCWCTIMAVKFSFMFFFKKLIGRLPTLTIYWWIIFAYNVIVLGYGASVYYVVCPYSGGDPRGFLCNTTGKGPLVAHSTAQMTLDLFGDTLVLAIPIAVVWKIRVHWTQRLALGFSLCLTVFLIIITIVRVSGIVYADTVDNIWEIYWTLLSAEVGIIMAAAISFRAFFVARSNSKKSNLSPQEQARQFFKQSYLNRKRRRKDGYIDTFDSLGQKEAGLPSIPRAYMTGVRTFMDNHGKSFDSTETKTSSVGSSVGSDAIWVKQQIHIASETR